MNIAKGFKRKGLTRAGLLLLVCAGSLSLSVNAREDIGSQLPPDVRGLLIQEMIAILGSTQTIVNAMVRGEDETVAREAQRIHDSFILAQELSEEQHDALVAAASAEFLAKDEAFHEMSASLAEAARAGDKAEQQKVFTQMLNACVVCHTEHAAERFPGFFLPIDVALRPRSQGLRLER